MKPDRVLRILRPSLALVAITAALIVLGLALTHSAGAASAAPPASPAASFARTTRSGWIVQARDPVTVNAGQEVAGVVSFGGDVTIAGIVHNNVVVFGGDVHLLPTAVVGSDLRTSDSSVVVFNGTVTRDPGAQVAGKVQRFEGRHWASVLGWVARHTVIHPWWGFSFVGWVVQTAFFLVLALVAAALMPNQLRAVQRHLQQKPAASFGWGALGFFVVVPAVLVVLIVSIVGLLLVLPYAVVVPLFYFFVITAVAAFVAVRVLVGMQQKPNLMLAVTLGVLGTTIVSRIPVVGVLALGVMAVFGTGAAGMAFVEWRRSKRPAPAAPAMVAPAQTFGGAPPPPSSAMTPVAVSPPQPPVHPPAEPPAE
jgi:hypothetical protein